MSFKSENFCDKLCKNGKNEKIKKKTSKFNTIADKCQSFYCSWIQKTIYLYIILGKIYFIRAYFLGYKKSINKNSISRLI